MPVNQEDYAYATAIITHAVISKSIEVSYPGLTSNDRDEMFISIIDRIARMRGWAIKRDGMLHEDSE